MKGDGIDDMGKLLVAIVLALMAAFGIGVLVFL